jgi:hypothetical protein
MRGPKSTYSIQLSPQEAKQLHQLVQAHKTPQAHVVRARIVLTVHKHPDWSAPQIAQASQTSDRMVRKWRKRWLTRLALEHRGVFPPEVRAQVTATACSLPRQIGAPLARWSRSEIARWIADSLPSPAPSASTVGRWLKAERICPWRYHAWQHIHDPKQFLQRARPVLQVYAQALTLLREGSWSVCLPTNCATRCSL